MEHGPVPPHERPWRHPSELPPPAHEPTTTSGRVLIATSATVTLLMIGLLAVAMTPDRSGTEVAVSTSSQLARTTPAALTTPVASPLPFVTPVGDQGWAVTTLAALGELDQGVGAFTARLPSGATVEVEVVATDERAGLAVVALPSPQDGSDPYPRYELAGWTPAPTDTVFVPSVDADPVELSDLRELSIDEATPVLDDDGALIGLCTRRDGVTSLMTIAALPTDPTVTTTTEGDPSTATTTSGSGTATATTTPETDPATTSTVVTSTTTPETGPSTTSTTSTVPPTTTTEPSTSEPPTSSTSPDR